MKDALDITRYGGVSVAFPQPFDYTQNEGLKVVEMQIFAPVFLAHTGVGRVFRAVVRLVAMATGAMSGGCCENP